MKPDEARSLALHRGWLSRQPADFAQRFVCNATLRTLSRDSMLYGVGDPPGGLYCLVSGLVDVLIAPAGSDPVLAHVGRPGAWLGEAALLSETTRRVAIIGRTDCMLLYVAQAEVRQIAREDPETWRRIAELSVAHFDTALSYAICRAAEDKTLALATTLLRLSEPSDPEAGPVVVELSQTELGEICGLSRNSVGRALAPLVRRRLVALSYRRLTILDSDALRAMTER